MFEELLDLAMGVLDEHFVAMLFQRASAHGHGFGPFPYTQLPIT